MARAAVVALAEQVGVTAVSGGKVRGFRITTRTTCGGYVGSDAVYSVSLRLIFVSPTKAKGSFSYYGPARWVAVESFTVRRR